LDKFHQVGRHGLWPSLSNPVWRALEYWRSRFRYSDVSALEAPCQEMFLISHASRPFPRPTDASQFSGYSSTPPGPPGFPAPGLPVSRRPRRQQTERVDNAQNYGNHVNDTELWASGTGVQSRPPVWDRGPWCNPLRYLQLAVQKCKQNANLIRQLHAMTGSEGCGVCSGNTPVSISVQSESRKIPPQVFWHFSQMVGNC